MDAWVEFSPVKNRKMIFDLAESLMRIRPVRLESVPEGWKLSIFIGKEKRDAKKMVQLV
ncbi:MAG: hypothetical protein L5655_05615 [Thermosediminibacteraceae bacterium]|nr:hypothetical protein [Thermosediminibacteraceae bacterium]